MLTRRKRKLSYILDSYPCSELDEEDPDYLPSDEDDYTSESDYPTTDVEEVADVEQPPLKRTKFTRLSEIQTYIHQTEPNLEDILLKGSMSMEDRARLFQLYEIYKSLEPNTEQWFEFRSRLVGEMKLADRVRPDQGQSSNLLERIDRFITTESNRQAILNKYQRLTRSTDDEYAKLHSWIEWALRLPESKLGTGGGISRISTPLEVTAQINHAMTILDRNIFGLYPVKEQIVLFLSNRLLYPRDCIHTSLGFCGPPGCSKTVLGRLLSQIFDCGFYQIALGGVKDSSFLRGHSYTYIGSQPGEMVKALCSMEREDGILFFDEVDKVESPDIVNTLLHITDNIQNSTFRDEYLDGINIDLSRMMFVYSMNQPPKDSALRDRMMIININGYDESTKINIMDHHLIPDLISKVKTTNIHFPQRTKRRIAELHADSGGVRDIKRLLTQIILKLDFYNLHPHHPISRGIGKIPVDSKGRLVVTTEFVDKHSLVNPV